MSALLVRPVTTAPLFCSKCRHSISSALREKYFSKYISNGAQCQNEAFFFTRETQIEYFYIEMNSVTN